MINEISRDMLTDEIDENEISVFHKEINDDLRKFWNIIKSSSTGIDKNGYFITEHEKYVFHIPTIPKTKQKGPVTRYKSYLRDHISGHKQHLKRFIGKELLVYLIVYLDEKDYKEKDVDNFPKRFLDVLKEFAGDDKNIKTLIVEKKKVESIKSKDPGILEQWLVFIADASYKDYIVK